MVLTEVSILHHVALVLLLLWCLNSYDCCHPIANIVALVYLYQVHDRCDMRLRRKLRHEENRATNQRRVLTDSESVRWLNHAIGKIWPICMEPIISQKIFLPIIPWFLDKYKPWTVKQAVVQQLYLGRSAPLFTDMRVLHDSNGDDHLVMELGLNFLTADDMNAVLYAKLRRRLGFGMMAKMHLTGMHVEGKVLVGVKFLPSWPFIGRLRVCFVETPYFQVTVKPIFNHGLDVAEVPGIAGWLDKLMANAFEETLVQPNMLVVDMEKFISPHSESWFSVVVKEPIAHVNVEVIEALEVKPSDLNGLADPYVKGHLGSYKFKTQIQKKTLTPKWQEEFRIPICSWDFQNMLIIVVRDKDHFVDGALGNCTVNINGLRDGQRHDIWLPLENVKMGRLHLAVTVVEAKAKDEEQNGEEKKTAQTIPESLKSETNEKGPSSPSSVNKSGKVSDTFQPIDFSSQKESGIWVQHPGSETSQTWEPRKAKGKHVDTETFLKETKLSKAGSFKIHSKLRKVSSQTSLKVDDDASKLSTHSSDLKSDSSGSDEGHAGHKASLGSMFQKGFHKMLHKHSKEDSSSSFGESFTSRFANVKNIKTSKGDGLFEHTITQGSKNAMPESPSTAKGNFPETPTTAKWSFPDSPSKYDVKGMAKSMFKNAGKSARSIKHVLSRKGSKKFSENPEGVLDNEYSSGDESASSSVYGGSSDGIPVTSSLLSRSDRNDAQPTSHIQGGTTGNVGEAAEGPSAKGGKDSHKTNQNKAHHGVHPI